MKESENPKVPSEERKRYLLEKWGAIMDQHELTADEYKDKLRTSVIYEAQERWHKLESI